MSPLDGVEIIVYGAEDASRGFEDACRLYRTVYAEPPYLEGEEDFTDFEANLPLRANQPGFRMTLAYAGAEAIGFALGHELDPGSRWWDGTRNPLSPEFKTEHAGRTFALIELAVLAARRKEGVARALYDALVDGLTTSRATLLVRPDAAPAKSFYDSIGFIRVDNIVPFTGGPTYDLMLKELVTYPARVT